MGQDADGLLKGALLAVRKHGVTIEQLHAVRVHDDLLGTSDTGGLVTEGGHDTLAGGHVRVVVGGASHCLTTRQEAPTMRWGNEGRGCASNATATPRHQTGNVDHHAPFLDQLDMLRAALKAGRRTARTATRRTVLDSMVCAIRTHHIAPTSPAAIQAKREPTAFPTAAHEPVGTHESNTTHTGRGWMDKRRTPTGNVNVPCSSNQHRNNRVLAAAANATSAAW